MNRGFTFIDILIGTFLMVLVFLAIFGAYQLGMKVVVQTRNKITATAIANQWIEKIRNLPYEDIGTIGASPSPPYAEGVLEPATTTTLNNAEYNISVSVKYIADDADGLAAPDDQCVNDYKRAQVAVSWKRRFKGEVVLVTDVAPKNLTQECETKGGILSVTVFNAHGTLVASPLIEIKDPATDELIDSYTPSSGKHNFPLATSTYKVVASKSGYSTDRTYGIDEVAQPEKPHPIVLEGEVTEISFAIDKLSSFKVDTLSTWGKDYFSDSFLDKSKVAEYSKVAIGNGEVKLLKTNATYKAEGYIISQTIEPAQLKSWDEFDWTDETPSKTEIRYQVLYFDGKNWVLVPDKDLPGNSDGLSPPPVDLSEMATTTYPKIRTKATLFSLDDHKATPVIYDWRVSWITSEPTSIANVTFLLQGEKLIGHDANDNPVYKYSATSTSDSNGHVDITDLEWDNYTFSVDPDTGLDLVDTDPSPQPIALDPDTILPVKLYLEAENSLLVTVQDRKTLDPIFSAEATSSSATYQKTQYTNEDGQTYFIPLEEGTYHLEVSATGYLSTSTTVLVQGDESETIRLKRAE